MYYILFLILILVLQLYNRMTFFLEIYTEIFVDKKGIPSGAGNRRTYACGAMWSTLTFTNAGEGCMGVLSAVLVTYL